MVLLEMILLQVE